MSEILNGTLLIPSAPSDLSEVNHLTKSQKYKIEVKKASDAVYSECFVYETDNYAGNYFNSEHCPQETASFAAFSFEDTAVDVRITCNFDVKSVIIRPLNYEIKHTCEGNVITFTLNEPRKLAIEVNDRLNPLFIFSDAPDVPDENATYYYGPGVHQIGMQKLIRSGESVYIAGGAIVQGTFKVEDKASNVTIRGRGIINVGSTTLITNNCQWLSEHVTISAKENNHLLIEGVILTNAAGWTIQTLDSRGWDMPKAMHIKPENSYNNEYRNLKLISWNGCTDGIWFDGDHQVIDDCFIFNNDDGVTTHGSNHCKISNVTFWGGTFGRFFMHTNWASSSDLVFENINIIGKEMYQLILIHGTDFVKTTHELKDIVFRNVRVEEHAGTFLSMDAKNMKITNVRFENLTIDRSNRSVGSILCSTDGNMSDITFVDCKVDGKYVTSAVEAKIETDCGEDVVRFIRK